MRSARVIALIFIIEQLNACKQSMLQFLHVVSQLYTVNRTFDVSDNLSAGLGLSDSLAPVCKVVILIIHSF